MPNTRHPKALPRTRHVVADDLAYAVRAAKREYAVVGTPKDPTPWDRVHHRINRLLTEYETAPD